MAPWVLLTLLLLQSADPKALEWLRKAEALIGTPEEYSEKQAEYLRQATQIAPDFALARFNLALVHLHRQEFEEAVEQFTAFIELEPDDSRGYLLRARCALALKKSEPAREDLERALAIEPEDSEAWDVLGGIHYRAQRWSEAASAWQKAYSLNDDDPEVLFFIGICQRELNQIPEAVQTLESFLSRAPDHFPGHYQLGLLYSELGNEAKALTQFLAAEQIDPSDADLAQRLGDLFLRMGQPEEARIRLAKADPESAENLANLGIIALGEKQWAEAEDFLRRSLAKSPFNALMWGYLADALLAQKKSMEALAAFDRALAYDPDDLKSLIHAGTISADNDRAESAKEYLSRALKLAPEDGFIHFSLAVVLERLKEDSQAAQGHYLKALELGENRPYAHFRLAFLFAEQSEVEKAIKHVEEALKGDAPRFHPLLVQELRKVHSDLDSIRYSSHFAQLMQEHQPPESP